MARQRKKNREPIPLASPSSASNKQSPSKPLIEISEEEQWRIINESGILKAPALQNRTVQNMEYAETQDERLSLGDEVFNAILLIIPFSGLLLLMEILVRQQYGKDTTMDVILDRMVPSIPILSLFIFYTIRYKSTRWLQYTLLLLSVTVGSRMLWLLSNASWLVSMKQCPPLATIWIYTVLQLDLPFAVGNLVFVSGFVWWRGLKVLR